MLSLENHCSVPQQEVMARHLKTLLAGKTTMLERRCMDVGTTSKILYVFYLLYVYYVKRYVKANLHSATIEIGKRKIPFPRHFPLVEIRP